MKLLVAIFALYAALSSDAFAKAYFQTKYEMIDQAEAIAIISISQVQSKETKGKIWTYRQTASAQAESVLKGNLPKEFKIYGAETFICAQCPLESGRYLAFLKKDGDLWTGSNWHLSLRPIKDNRVDWYIADDNRYEMKAISLEKVLHEIKDRKD